MKTKEIGRREVLQGAAAISVVAAACLPAAADVPRQSCGCAYVHEISYGHSCVVHDETGRRWDSYTEDDVATSYGQTFDVQTAATEWSCYCGRHEDDLMPIGTRCVWQQTSYFENEWECECASEFREQWLNCQTTDWYAMAKADGLA